MARRAGVSDDGYRFEFSRYAYLEFFAQLVAQHERKEMQAKIETLHAMYELASKQRDALMDEQRAQVAAWRVEHAINKAKNT